MTRKEQNKILDNKIESNVNQYKVDRLNAEISAFSSGDLNKYEFLTRKIFKPNALDKARFQFSPLGQTFSIGLDKTAQGYQEEGITKLLKDRDSLAGGVRPPGPDDNNDNDNDNNDDNNDNDNDDNDNDDNDNDNNNDDDNNDKFSEYQEVINSLIEKINNDNVDDNVALNSVFLNNLHNLNNEISNVKSDGEYYVRLIVYQNATIEKSKKELTDRKNLTKDIIDETSKIINENKKEHLEYHNKYKNTLFDYIKTLKQLNNAENTYGREIGNLNNTINDEAIRKMN